MFYTAAQAESPMPAGLSSSRVRRWRAFNIPIDLPWFVVTFRIGVYEGAFKTTWAVASDVELADLIAQHCGDDLVKLHCYMPSNFSKDEIWSMRVGASVWRSAIAPEKIVIRDVDGEAFSGGRLVGPQDVGGVDHPLELVAEVLPAKQARRNATKR